MKRFVHPFFILALLALTFLATVRTPARAAAPAWVDTSSRQASQDFYISQYLSSENVPANWTGVHATCNAGTTSNEFKDAVLRRINYFRAMAGVPDVSLSASANQNAQAAALMMSVNGQLSHSPPATWTCYTAEGALGASKSNLSLGSYGPSAISGQVRDYGSGNYAAGHRRWILYPPTQQMGTGDIPPSGGYWSSNALWVIGNTGPRPVTREPYVAWPPPGYVPYQVIFARWSFSYPNANFSAATVTMVSGGTNIPLTQESVVNGYGDNTLVWRPYSYSSGDPWPKPTNDTTYRVTVSNVLVGGAPQTFTYDVTAFDPLLPTVTNDEIENAINIITPYSNAQSVEGATTATDDPVFTCLSGKRYRTVWYKFTPVANGILTVDTFGSNYDTVLAAWTGERGNLTSIGCNDDDSSAGNGVQSKLTLANLTAGTTYYIEIASFDASPTNPMLQLNATFGASWVGGISIESDQSIVAVARPHLGSQIASYIGANTGSTTQYVPMLFKDAFGGGSYKSALYIQNLGSDPASLTIEFINDSGAVVHTITEPLAAKASKGYWLSGIAGIPAGFAGAAKVTADQPVLAVGRPHIGAEVMSYNGMSSGSTTAWLPMFFKNGFGNYNTALYVQNVANASADLTIEYLNLDGTVACTYGDTLAANASKGYWSLSATCDTGSLPVGFVGGVKVTSTENILAVGRAHLGTQITTYNGFAGGAPTAYVPMLFRNAFANGSYKAALYLQNVGGASADVTIEYVNDAGAVSATQNVTLASGAISSIWLPGVAGLPDGFVGGARITSTQDVIAVGRPHLGAEITAYNGAPLGSTSAYLPMLFKNAFAAPYNAAFYIQNVTGNTANVDISFYDDLGALSCIKAISLAPNATQGFWMPSVSCAP